MYSLHDFFKEERHTWLKNAGGNIVFVTVKNYSFGSVIRLKHQLAVG
jgi:hypothetical protein